MATRKRARGGATSEGVFLTTSLDDARKFIPTPEFLTPNRKFIEGDHWQDGDGWAGPRLPDTDPEASAMLDEIARAFTSRNVIAEIVDRHVDALTSREPQWGLALRRPLGPTETGPTEQELTEMAEVRAALTEWWDAREARTMFTNALKRLLWAERGALRLYVPRGKLATGTGGTTGVQTQATLPLALAMIYPDDPQPESATLHEDEDTREPIGVYIFKSADGNTEVAELTYRAAAPVGDRPPTTIIRHTDGTEVELDLSGYLTLHEVKRPLFITEQLRQGQKALNLALSMIPRNVVTGGFLERILLNAQMPGRFEETKNARGQVISRKFIPEQYITGPGTTNFVQGQTYKDKDGNTILASPSIHFREPVPVLPAAQAKQEHYQDMLEEADQAHVLRAGSTETSGRSQEMARADFIMSVSPTRIRAEALGRWFIGCALAMGEAFMNKPGLYTLKYRVTFTCVPDYGPISADERRQNTEDFKAGVISQETAMERNGVEDTDDEMARIQGQPGALLDVSLKQSAVFDGWIKAGASPEFAASKAGLTEEEVTQLLKDYTEPTPPETTVPGDVPPEDTDA